MTSAEMQELEDALEQNELDAKRYRWLKTNGYANEKNIGNAVIGDSKRAQVSFRYWCNPLSLDSLIDAEIAKY